MMWRKSSSSHRLCRTSGTGLSELATWLESLNSSQCALSLLVESDLEHKKKLFFFAYAGLQMQHWFKQSEWRMEPSDCMTNITEHEHGRHATRPNPPQQHDITVFFYSNQRASESRVVQRVHTAAAYCPLVTESWPWGVWGREGQTTNLRHKDTRQPSKTNMQQTPK